MNPRKAFEKALQADPRVAFEAAVRTAAWDASTDDWFDAIVDAEPDLKDSKVKRLADLVGKYPRIKPATKTALDKIEKALGGISERWARDVLKHIKKMRDGAFNREFKRFEGKVSQINSLMSLLAQALYYNE